MTNKEIKEMCLAEQVRVGGDDYPKYTFKIQSNKSTVKIYWEYLDDGEFWEIEKEDLIARNESRELMNENFDYYGTLEETIKSCVYYMVTRY